MIEKFNFYDIYGYFLPGLAFLGVLALPFIMVHPSWRPGEWGSAIAALALAYLLGHFLQGLATNALPSNLAANKRFPSAALLDPSSELPAVVTGRIAEIVLTKFGLDLKVNEVGVPHGEVDKARNSAFNLARLVLSKDKFVSYPEQFEGMYALSRGLAVGLGVGSFYLSGWAVGNLRMTFKIACVVELAFILVGLGVLLWLVILSSQLVFGNAEENVRTLREKKSLVALGLALLCAGYFVGRPYASHNNWLTFALIAIAMLIVSFRLYNAYKFFARHFAKTVWRDFLAFNAFHQD